MSDQHALSGQPISVLLVRHRVTALRHIRYRPYPEPLWEGA